MKRLIHLNRIAVLLLILLNTGISKAQTKYLDKHGIVVFEASEKLFEPVKAKNESVTVIFDPSTNKIASLALMRGFQFPNPLMQEHFNENYIESESYPKAVFQGEIMGLNIADLNEISKEYTVKGILEVREHKKEISPKVQMQMIGNVISLRGSFIVLPGDFDIKIPKIVANKIAREVIVKMDFKLEVKDEK